MEEFSMRDKLRYRFDQFMALGAIAQIIGLAIMTLVLISCGGLAVKVLDARPEGTEAPLGFFEAVWGSLMRTLDAGTMGGDSGWTFRFLMFIVTLGGVFITATLIGLISSGIEAKIDELRKGRSRVIESGHTVILGLVPETFLIISELAEAHAHKSDHCIVVMADQDKVEMEDAISEKIEDLKSTRVVCRTGDPLDQTALEIASLKTARSIIILPPSDAENPDAFVIKVLLAILNGGPSSLGKYHIVAEIREAKNIEVAKLAGRGQVELIHVGDIVARITAQTCRRSGMSVVYTELMNFGGDEIYFKEEPRLVGKKFGDILLDYEDSSIIGLMPAGGVPMVNPAMDRVIGKGDQIIAVSENDESVKISDKRAPIDEKVIQLGTPATHSPEKTLILGWNRNVPLIIIQLDQYVAKGSEVMVMADEPDGERMIKEECSSLVNQTVSFKQGDTTDRKQLEALNVNGFNRVILQCYSDKYSIQAADSISLISLLHLRDIMEKSGKPVSIVSEILDLRNRELAHVAHPDDFIISNHLVGLMLSQVSHNKDLNAVFFDIFDPEGSEVYLKLAKNYVKTGTPVTFATVVEAARRRGEIAFGWQAKADVSNPEKDYGVCVNPNKSDVITFAEWDRIILMAETD